MKTPKLLSIMPENPRLLSLGMNGIPERSVGHSFSRPKAPAFRPEIGLLATAVIFWLASVASAGQVQDYLRVIAQAANIRASADIAGPVIAIVQRGTILEMLGEQGEWYLTRTPAEGQGQPQIGYISKTAVQVINADGRQAPPPAKPQPRPQPAGPSEYPDATSAPKVNPFTGFSVKFGWMTSPSTGGFSDAWIVSLGYDFALGSNFAAGIEVQPAYRSYSDIQLTIIPAMAWFHVKGGGNLGGILKFLKFADLYIGLGAGGEGSFASLKTDTGTLSHSQFQFGYQGLIGTAIHTGTVKLIAEFQLSQILDPNVKPNYWRQFILLGIRF